MNVRRRFPKQKVANSNLGRCTPGRWQVSARLAFGSSVVDWHHARSLIILSVAAIKEQPAVEESDGQHEEQRHELATPPPTRSVRFDDAVAMRSVHFDDGAPVDVWSLLQRCVIKLYHKFMWKSICSARQSAV